MHLWLTGFMGAGKTTTGRRLARILRMPFADTDVEIEREHGAISEIFASSGETHFRELEAAAIDSISRREPAVIAVGGGAILSSDNRAVMRASGAIVHLSISAAGAFARVSHRSHRPLLGPAPVLADIEKVMAARAKAYADNDYRVFVDGKDLAAVAHTVARWYRRRVAGQVASPR